MISDNLIVASSISAVYAESEDYISATFGDKYIEKKIKFIEASPSFPSTSDKIYLPRNGIIYLCCLVWHETGAHTFAGTPTHAHKSWEGKSVKTRNRMCIAPRQNLLLARRLTVRSWFIYFASSPAAAVWVVLTRR